MLNRSGFSSGASGTQGGYSQYQTVPEANAAANRNGVTELVNRIVATGIMPREYAHNFGFPAYRSEHVDTRLTEAARAHAERMMPQSREEYISSALGLPLELRSAQDQAHATLLASQSWSEAVKSRADQWRQSPAGNKLAKELETHWNQLASAHVMANPHAAGPAAAPRSLAPMRREGEKSWSNALHRNFLQAGATGPVFPRPSAHSATPGNPPFESNARDPAQTASGTSGGHVPEPAPAAPSSATNATQGAGAQEPTALEKLIKKTFIYAKKGKMLPNGTMVKIRLERDVADLLRRGVLDATNDLNNVWKAYEAYVRAKRVSGRATSTSTYNAIAAKRGLTTIDWEFIDETKKVRKKFQRRK
ncbi:MAG TPA: hypothetical protein VIG66_00955 [Noviherbaspirillum sp.]